MRMILSIPDYGQMGAIFDLTLPSNIDVRDAMLRVIKLDIIKIKNT